MKRFTDQPLFWQLFLPMLLVVALWAGSMAIAIGGLTESRSLLHGLYNTNVQMVFRLQRLKRHFANHNRLVLEHLATESARQMQGLRQRLRDLESTLEADLGETRRTFNAIHPERGDNVGELVAAFHAYLQTVNDVIRLSRDFEKEAAFTIFHDRTQETLRDTEAYLANLTALEADSMQAAYNASLNLEVRNAWTTGIAGAIALVTSVVLLYMVARLTAGRLQRVVDSAVAMGNGDLSARTNAGESDEIGRLGRNLDRMAGELHRTMGELEATARELRHAHGELEQRVAERTRDLEAEIAAHERTEQDLLRAKEQADAANRAKSEFLANMSHELRTPLNAIIGFSEAALTEVFGPLGDKYREYASNVHSSGHHLLGLINDILDMSKIETGNLDLANETVDPKAVIDEVVKLIRAQPDRSLPEIVAEAPDAEIGLRADRRRLRQILVNLLANATKFTGPDGRVTVSLERRADGSLTLAVTDTGIGMTDDEQARAMEPFGQVDSSLSRRFDGTGLGLPLTRKLMEEHGGSLTIDSEKGVGTTVCVRFPADRVLRPADREALG